MGFRMRSSRRRSRRLFLALLAACALVWVPAARLAAEDAPESKPDAQEEAPEEESPSFKSYPAPEGQPFLGPDGHCGFALDYCKSRMLYDT